MNWEKEPGRTTKIEVAYAHENGKQFMRVTDKTKETQMRWYREGNDLEKAKNEFWVQINSIDLPETLKPRAPAEKKD